MDAKAFIGAKRLGQTHSQEALSEFLSAFLAGEVPDYQMSAWLMAVCCRGMEFQETAQWTQLMLNSGSKMPGKTAGEFWIDKHSTGGVGDKTSLILVPLVHEVCERLLGSGKVKIPMVSGRGLGHTGGTLDKLESVPGFNCGINLEEARSLIRENGFVMMGQTKELAPADKRIYALRDASGTVESTPLIVSSILSKKLAENIDGLVMDIKFGAGAFMKTLEDAENLADTLTRVARESGVDTVAVITSMEEPLGTAVGHLWEVAECGDFLLGKASDRGLEEVTVGLATWMIHMASHREIPLQTVRKEVGDTIKKGSAAEGFRKMFEAQGGQWTAYCRQVESLPETHKEVRVLAPQDGVIQMVHPEGLGRLVSHWGGGRQRATDSIDFLVGLKGLCKVGDRISAGDLLATAVVPAGLSDSEVEKDFLERVSIQEKPIFPTRWIQEFR